jgi:hypothetical protein
LAEKASHSLFRQEKDTLIRTRAGAAHLASASTPARLYRISTAPNPRDAKRLLFIIFGLGPVSERQSRAIGKGLFLNPCCP